MNLNDEWYTPKDLFDALNLEFDLDPASNDQNTIVPAKEKYVLPKDGLVEPWHGLVWLNPPYSKPSPWVDKWLDHGNGMILTIFAKSYWNRKLWNDNRVSCIAIHPPKFHRPDGSRMQIKWPVHLWAIGDVSYQALVRSNLGRVR